MNEKMNAGFVSQVYEGHYGKPKSLGKSSTVRKVEATSTYGQAAVSSGTEHVQLASRTELISHASGGMGIMGGTTRRIGSGIGN